jgi:predicted nuclease of predicted toxin-antitoxin system
VKLLLDTCVRGKACDELSAAGHDVIWSGAWPQDPGDEEILAPAHRDGRVMVTLDKDFGELAMVHGSAHSGILRLVNIAARQQAAVCCASSPFTAKSWKRAPLSPPNRAD